MPHPPAADPRGPVPQALPSQGQGSTRSQTRAGGPGRASGNHARCTAEERQRGSYGRPGCGLSPGFVAGPWASGLRRSAAPARSTAATLLDLASARRRDFHGRMHGHPGSSGGKTFLTTFSERPRAAGRFGPSGASERSCSQPLRAVLGDTTPQQIRPLLARLPPDTLYEEVQLFLKCR